MISITDDFTLTRSGTELVVEVFGAFPARVRLTIEEVKLAQEAFGIMAAMMEAADDSNSCDEIEPEVLKLEVAA